MKLIFWLCMVIGVAVQVDAATFDNSKFDTLLKQHVVVLAGGRVTQVDYAALQTDRASLQEYLHSLTALAQDEFDAYPPDDQLALLINAYNGWTLELILARYPDLESIRDLGSFFQSPWKKKFFSFLGKARSLDDIEHNLIRGSGRYNDPRIHFAVNCASIGCPALRAEAYSGEKLQLQLTEATELFLGDRERNRLRDQVLEVSPIFKWYNQDFEKGWLEIKSLNQFFASYSQALGFDENMKDKVKSGEVKIVFLNYDWRLNGKSN